MERFEQASSTPISEKRVPEQERVKQLFLNLEETLGKDDSKAVELLKQIDRVFALHQGELQPDFSHYIHKIAAEYPDAIPSRHSIIVRREDPQRLIEALTNDETLKIDFRPEAHGGDAYPNSGMLGWDASGLRIPYQRGFGKIGEGKIVVVLGFTPDLEHLTAEPIPKDAYPHYADAKERSLIRMVEGEVASEDIRFVAVRIPKKVFPVEAMTEEELENEKLFYISRLYSFGEKKETGH